MNKLKCTFIAYDKNDVEIGTYTTYVKDSKEAEQLAESNLAWTPKFHAMRRIRFKLEADVVCEWMGGSNYKTEVIKIT